MTASPLYDFDVVTIDSQAQKLSAYAGKALLIVNVASRCGFTPQYKTLQELYLKYKDQGFVVLGFPCNQFRNQEPESEASIKQFCEFAYNVTFPMFSKIEVNGKAAHPLYKYLTEQKRGIFGTRGIKWNFTKFLIDRNGKVLKRFAPSTDPASMDGEIEKALR